MTPPLASLIDRMIICRRDHLQPSCLAANGTAVSARYPESIEGPFITLSGFWQAKSIA